MSLTTILIFLLIAWMLLMHLRPGGGCGGHSVKKKSDDPSDRAA
jgi:hypothetical protein